MKGQCRHRRIIAILLGAFMLTGTGCLGPNPLYSIGQTALNSTIMTFVSTFWSGILGGS